MKTDKIFKYLLYGSGVSITLLLTLIFLSLFVKSFPAISRLGIKFFTGRVWDPVTEKFSVAPFVAGTFLTSILALLISVPFSVSIALFLGEYYKKGIASKFLNYTTDLLAGIPSVIYGFWGLLFLVPIVRSIQIKLGIMPYGVGIFTASIVLSIMIIPYTSSLAREVIRLVPSDLKEAAYSLGATQYEVIKKIVLPYALSGIAAGILLSFGRALGETMAVTMVIGNSNYLPKNIFSPANTMASVIANEFTEATKNIHLSALIEIGFILFIITFVVNLLGDLVIKRLTVNGKDKI